MCVFVSVGVSLCKEEIGWQWGVKFGGTVGTEGVGGFEEVLFGVTHCLSPLLLSLLLICGVGRTESQACARTSPGKFIKRHLHL